jgi:hypothetical protein
MEAGFFVNIDFLTWNWNLGKFGHSSLVRPGLDFFNGRFQSDNLSRASRREPLGRTTRSCDQHQSGNVPRRSNWTEGGRVTPKKQNPKVELVVSKRAKADHPRWALRTHHR